MLVVWLGRCRRNATPTGFVGESDYVSIQEARRPFIDKTTAYAHRTGNVGYRIAVGQHQNNAAAPGQPSPNAGGTLLRFKNNPFIGS